jgi:two-component sensor histidine kinase
MSFGEDRVGNLWLGFRDGGLARYSARYNERRFTLFTAADGLPVGSVRELFIDRAGRLWIASGKGGVGRVDDPGAARPRFATVTISEGLSSNDVWCITDDRAGQLYIGTARGLDRLDPDAGRIESLAALYGLPQRTVTFGFRDRQDALWFSTNAGFARLAPDSDATRPRPAVAISGLRFGGRAQPLPALGVRDAGVFEVGPNQNNLSVDFFAINFGGPVQYQYKLENGASDWSAPTAEHTANYPGLSPGTYRFLVRAVKADGVRSPVPAAVTFTILPPVWRRWWFLTPGALLFGALLYGAYRYRVAQLIRVERVRTRIATDLHDDIGSNLSLIAGLSRVLRDQVGERDPAAGERLSVIANVSSRSVEAMSDIIWAVNPRKDNLSDLSQRMRRFASDAFTAREIEFSFSAPDLDQQTRVNAETRREVFLTFKEAVNNTVRHSACTEAGVALEIDHGKLVLRVSDNGRGFDQQSAEYGNGVTSMKARADKLGGGLEIASAAGRGTTVTLTVPLRR